ncbi:MAG: hypothetical protein IH831_02890 [Planctomycetes bacterium]|nr:hypothetical protein [Planctomycetota bacterium]
MSSIATCPQCAAQLAVPETASASDQAQCPECRAEFLLAEGDLRYLSLAKIVEPVKATPPEPEREKPPLATELPEAELPQAAFSEERRAADTISSASSTTSTFSGWEERLRTAIDSTEKESAGEPEIAGPPASEESSLEKSPKFEFEMDPPAESPDDSSASATTILPETRDWFEPTPEQTTSEQTVEESRTTAVQVPAEDARAATEPAAPVRRRKKNSLLKRATVVVLFGAVGIVLGQYALFWIRGPSADYLHIAQFVPRVILPSARSPVIAPQISPEERFVSDNGPVEKSDIENLAQELLAQTEPVERELAPPARPPAVTHDDFVQPATVQLPEVGQSPEVSPLPPTNTTPADFERLLGSAHDSAPALVEGDLSTQESARVKGRAYMALCRLAEHFDFVRLANLDDDARSLALSAQSLLRATAGQTAARNDLAWIVSRWWQHQARPNQGVFLVGRIQDIEAMGSRTLCQVAVVHAAELTLIPVLLPDAAYQVGDQIGVVGTIVTEPRTVIPGFTADLPQIAVALDSFSVPTE